MQGKPSNSATPLGRATVANALLALLVGIVVLASGCTHVAPYEREYLARPGMDNLKRESKYNAFVAHVIEAREGAGAVGLADSSGGGCGCN